MKKWLFQLFQDNTFEVFQRFFVSCFLDAQSFA